MKFSTIVGVYVENHPNPSALPNDPTCLCLEHQDTELPQARFTFPINAIQAYYTRATCAVCGKYLGLSEDQAPDQRPASVDALPRERVAALPDYEMRLLVALLKRIADYFGRRIHDDIDLAALVPSLEGRREMMRLYHEWNGDPEAFSEDEAVGQQYPFWTYSSALAYFAFRLAPDIEQELRKAAR